METHGELLVTQQTKSKVEKLHSALLRLAITTERVGALKSEINGQIIGMAEDCDKPPTPSLAELLNNAEELIYKQCDAIEGYLIEIREMLF